MAVVLLLGAGTQSLAIIPPIHKAGHRIVMVTGLHPNYGDRSRYVDKVYRYKSSDVEEYLSFLTNVAKGEHVDVIIPMGDADAELLSRYKRRFSEQKFKTPEYPDFLRGYDKNKLMSLCEEKGYPHPLTVDLAKVHISDPSVQNFPFPAMLKPNCTTGGRGMIEVASYDELCNKYPRLHAEYGDYHLQRFIKPGGKQVKVQLYISSDGQLLAYSVQRKMRWYPNKAGSNCCAMSIENDAMVDTCYNVLKDLGWIGFADFDTIEDPETGELLIMEINPRLPACIKGSIVAGVDWGNILVNDALGLPTPKCTYKTGRVLRHLGLDCLWFAHSDKKFNTEPGWFKFIGKNIFYQDMSDWTDPMPFLSGTFNNIKKLFDPKFRHAKQGA